MNKLSLVLLALLLLPPPAMSQEPVMSFEDLRQLGIKPNDTVYVTDTTGRTVKDKIDSLSDDSLTLRREGVLQESEVNRIEVGDSLQEGIWLGVALGIGVGYAAVHASCDLPDDECAAIVTNAIGIPATVGGAILGAIIDASRRRTVFASPARSRARRLELSPFLSHATRGIRMSLRF